MQKLRSWLPGQHASVNGSSKNAQRHSVSLEPEIGFQITIETATLSHANNLSTFAAVANDDNAALPSARASAVDHNKTTIPELNVHLIAARHLPALFGFKVVQGYLIKVKLFPGSKRLDSSIQTNSWPKFNENFRFPLAPDLKPSLKHSARRSSTKAVTEFTPEELFGGQFVVFTVYALLELPPASFNRFNKTYRSLRDKSTNLVQKVVESSSGKTKDDNKNDNAENMNDNTNANATKQSGSQKKKKSNEANPKDAIPPLTISESRRNIGSVTCYLEAKLFKRNTRTGCYSTEELWLPIKDITTTVVKGQKNNLANAAKGVVELTLELRDLSASDDIADPVTITPNNATSPSDIRNPQWNRMTSEVKRKIGFTGSNAKFSPAYQGLILRVTTARMRCNNKVKDELETTAGSVYVKTTVFEHGIYVDAWKSSNFYPSLSTKWDVGGDVATLNVPLSNLESLENVLIRTTLATKTRMGKKMVLGTVLVGCRTSGSGVEHIQALREAPLNERVPMWHSYQ